MINKYKVKVGTRVVFSPIDGSFATAEGTVTKRYEAGRSGSVSYSVRVVSESGAVKDWSCGPDDIISIEPTPGAWTMGGLAGGLWGAK